MSNLIIPAKTPVNLRWKPSDPWTIPGVPGDTILWPMHTPAQRAYGQYQGGRFAPTSATGWDLNYTPYGASFGNTDDDTTDALVYDPATWTDTGVTDLTVVSICMPSRSSASQGAHADGLVGWNEADGNTQGLRVFLLNGGEARWRLPEIGNVDTTGFSFAKDDLLVYVGRLGGGTQDLTVFNLTSGATHTASSATSASITLPNAEIVLGNLDAANPKISSFVGDMLGTSITIGRRWADGEVEALRERPFWWTHQSTSIIAMVETGAGVTSLIPRRAKTSAFTPVYGLSAKGLTLGLTSAGVIDGKGQPFDLVANEFLTAYNDTVPTVPTTEGMALEPGTGSTRSGDAYTIDHLGSNWLNGASEATIGVVYRFDGATSTDEDALIGQWQGLQGSGDPNAKRFFVRYDSTAGDLEVSIDTTGNAAGGAEYGFSGDIEDGEFHWIVARYDGANVSAWVDGVSLGNSAVTGTLNNTSHAKLPEFMGGHVVTSGTSADSPRGQFKAWFISERAWTDAEILEWYNPQTRWDWIDTGSQAPLLIQGDTGGGGGGLTVTMSQGLLNIIGQNPEVLLARDVSMQQGLVHATGQNADVITGRGVTMTQGVTHVTGQNPEVLLERELNLTQGLTHVTAQNMSITFGRTVTMGQGLVHVTGQDMIVQKGNFSPSWTRLSNNIIYIGSRGTKS